MFTVVKIKHGRGNKSTALLSDGRTIRVPKDQAWGSEISAEDIIDVDGELHHRSLVKEKKPRDYYLCRDLTGYDPKVELEQIRDFVSLMFMEIMGRGVHSEDEFEEVVSFCVEACVRRHIYEKYSPAWPGSYSGYLKRVIFNLLRDYRRKYYNHSEIQCFSLNKVMNEDGAEHIDFVAATGVDVCEQVEHKVLLEKLSVCVTRLDKEGTGLPGFTYKDLFDIMVNGESLDAYLRSFKFPRQLMDAYVENFREQLREELYGVWMVAA